MIVSWEFSNAFVTHIPTVTVVPNCRLGGDNLMSAMASCSSSLALSCGRHPLSSLHAARLFLKPQAVSFRNHLGLQWRRTSTVVACSEDSSKGVIIDVEVTNSERVATPVVQPRRKRGRPKRVKIGEPGSSSTAKETTTEEDEEDEEDEEEWDFFGELARHIENGQGSTFEEDLPQVEVASQTATTGSSTKSTGIDGSFPEAAANASSFGGRQGSEEQTLSEEDADDDDDIDLDDPKYQQKPDWMQDAVWESINNQLKDDDEGQPLWVEEDDPTWPAEEPEDGWGFRTSQFFDKVSIKNDKPDDGEDDDELRINWENEADDWMIQEITANEWESTVFGNPSPLVVYVFARYGRRGLDSWKTLEQLEKAATKVWESNKAPLRVCIVLNSGAEAVKVDIGMEIDLGSALGIGKDDCPQLLFIKNGKGLHRLEERRTSEELVQLMAHFFYNGAKPACLKTTSSPEIFRHAG